jgi:hypothetical protein
VVTAPLLGAGLTDEAAARRLGISLRTYRRQVAELMAALAGTGDRLAEAAGQRVGCGDGARAGLGLRPAGNPELDVLGTASSQ